MNGQSSNLPSPRYSSVTPSKNHHLNLRQPLYMQPNSPYMSPRGGRISTPGHNSGSPDFIPLGVSSPRQSYIRAKNWNMGNLSNNSSYSCSPPSSNSSFNFSPYKRNNFRGNFRGRRSFNNSNHSSSNSSNISLYIDKDALKDPWIELEGKMRNSQSFTTYSSQGEDGEASTAILDDSGSDISDGDDS